MKTVLRNSALDKFRLYATNPEFATAAEMFLDRISSESYKAVTPLSDVRLGVICRQLVYDGHDKVAADLELAIRRKLPVRWVWHEVESKARGARVRLDAWYYETELEGFPTRMIFMLRARRAAR